jgi:hypothetical protein
MNERIKRYILVRKPIGKRPFGKRRRRREDNIKLDGEGVSVDWLHMAQYRYQWQNIVNMVMEFLVP